MFNSPLKNSLILVVDVESTCWSSEDRAQSAETMEIIEIGAVLTNHSGEVISEFSSFVRPTENPNLSQFCSQLTGISQNMIESATTLTDVMPELGKWAFSTGAEMWGSWGRYDLTQFQSEIFRKSITTTLLGMPHLNLKRAWRRSNHPNKGQSLRAALQHHHMIFIGNHHRGLDDARNIARLLPFISGENFIRELDE